MKTAPFCLLILLMTVAPHVAARADGNYYNATLAAEADAAALAAAKAREQQATPATNAQTAQETIAVNPTFSRVTTLDSCLAQLPEKDRVDIKTRYSMPYRECQRRLMRIENAAAESKTADNAPEAKLPKGWKFLQVWKKNDKNKEPKP